MISVRKLLLSLLAVTIGLPALPASAANNDNPLVRFPNVSPQEFAAFAVTNNYVTLADHLETSRPEPNAKRSLMKAFERAQSAWLSGSIEEARTIFLDISEQALSSDWRDSQREAIHYSILRLAQSEENPLTQEAFIDRAFSSFSDLEIDASLFPPPIVSKFRARKQELIRTAKTIRLPGKISGFRFAVINGKKFDLNQESTLKIPRGDYRITLYSDVGAPVSKKLNREELIDFQIQAPTVLQGTCSNPNGAAISGAESYIAYYNKSCLRTRTLAGFTGSAPKKVESFFSSHAPNTEMNFPDVPSQSSTGLSKTTWIWIGASVLAAGLGYAAYRETQKDKQQVEPASRSGF